MKKLSTVILLVLFAAAFFLAGSWHGRQDSERGKDSSGRQILYYVDPMNPSHTSDKPGLAPCGMKMEPVYADSTPGEGTNTPSMMPAGTVTISAEKQQLIGVRTAPIEKTPTTRTLRTLGRVAADETRLYVINATIDGWITNALPSATGSFVKKDETLATFYSPEFLSASQALLFALNSMDRVQAQTAGNETSAQTDQLTQFNINLQQYKDSLRNLGMGNLQIEEMIQTRKFTESINVTSPADGFIVTRKVSHGLRFNKGDEMYRIADLSRVWILVDLFENEADWVRPGVKVQVSLPHQRKFFEATVSDILPQFDAGSRTLKARLEVDNPDFILKPDMFVDVEFPVELPPAIAVPADAVLDSGQKKTVFVDLGDGYFEPREVETGWRYDGKIEITEGLMPGERIVVSGNFLLDSESRMKMAAAGLHAAGSQDPVCRMNVDESKAGAAGLTVESVGKTYFFCSEECKGEFEKQRKAKSPGDENTPAAAPKGEHPAPVNASKAPEMIRHQCPVCAMNVYEKEGKPPARKSEYQGKTYYFCSYACKLLFDRDPDLFLKASGVMSGHSSAPSQPRAGEAHMGQ